MAEDRPSTIDWEDRTVDEAGSLGEELGHHGGDVPRRPTRPMGWSRRICASTSGRCARSDSYRSVLMVPSATALVRMPCGP